MESLLSVCSTRTAGYRQTLHLHYKSNTFLFRFHFGCQWSFHADVGFYIPFIICALMALSRSLCPRSCWFRPHSGINGWSIFIPASIGVKCYRFLLDDMQYLFRILVVTDIRFNSTMRDLIILALYAQIHLYSIFEVTLLTLFIKSNWLGR